MKGLSDDTKRLAEAVLKLADDERILAEMVAEEAECFAIELDEEG